MKRNLDQKIFDSYPAELEIITASADTREGKWSAIQVIVAAFPDNTTSFMQNGVGVNLSILNDYVVDGSGLMLLGNWTKLEVPLGNNTVIIAYKP